MDLIVVIPVYNEEECIKQVIVDWNLTLNEIEDLGKFQFLMLNDGSSDNSAQILDRLALENENVTVIHKQNSGHGNTIRLGYERALEIKSEFVFQTDSDNQFSPEDFSDFWEQRKNYDFILGYRKQRNDPFSRKIISNLMELVNKVKHGVSIPDANCPYRLMKSDLLAESLPKIPKDVFAPNIMLSLLSVKKGKYLFLPVIHKERKTGQTVLVSNNLLKACYRSFSDLLKFNSNA